MEQLLEWMERKTIRKEETEQTEYRYYISSLPEEIELFSRAVRVDLGGGSNALESGCNI